MGKGLGIAEASMARIMAPVRQRLRAQEFDAFREQCARGHFPVVRDCPIALRSEETAHLVCPVKVLETKAESLTHRTYVGTRIKLGKLPVYLGHSVPTRTYEAMTREIGEGLMVITNERVVLVGTKLDYSIGLSSILAVENPDAHTLQIHSEGRTGGRFYITANASAAAIILDGLVARQQS